MPHVLQYCNDVFINICLIYSDPISHVGVGLCNVTKPDNSTRFIEISKMICHENYNQSGPPQYIANDIVLVKLAENITFNDDV